MKVLTLGEIMLRFSTPYGVRLHQATTLDVCYGGGEANVGISLSNFGHEVAFASILPKNALAKAVKEHLHRYDVNTDAIIEEGERLGTYYLELGNSQKAPQVTYDRAYSSFAMAKSLPWTLHSLFKNVELFHISGIVPALSQQWRKWTVDLVQAAKEAGCLVSLDVNYRSKLWTQQEAADALEQMLPFVDFCSAGMLDAKYLLQVVGEEEVIPLEECYQRLHEKYPHIRYFYSTKREVISSSHNRLQGFVYEPGKLYASRVHEINPIVDRVGGGDAFSAGILHGLLKGWHLQQTLEFATAASVLKHAVYGDCNSYEEEEVLQFMNQESGKINR